jgi:hypothetical protein
MGNVELVGALERRFGLLIKTAELRLSANNLEMWENHEAAIPWTVLDTLAAYLDDTTAVHWLLTNSRAQDMLCVVMGFGRLIHCLEQEDAKAAKFAEAALESQLLGESFRLFALYWFSLPVDYWRTTDTAGMARQIAYATRD